jgi:hypothetical protein
LHRSRLSGNPGLTDGAPLAGAILPGIGWLVGRRVRCSGRTSGRRSEVHVALLKLDGRRFRSGLGWLPVRAGAHRDSEVGADTRIDFAVFRVGEIAVSPTCPARLFRR